MKLNLKTLVFRALVLTSTLVFTSCEGALDDIFGEWDKPAPQTSTTVAVTSISLDKATLELQVGKTGQLTATVDPAGTAVTWSSDKEEIATVEESGLVTAVAAGTAIITATANDGSGVKATCTVTVLPEGTLAGVFSVSGTDKVRFSKGNLQAKIASYASNIATASEWKFADSQYSYIGNAAGNNSFAVDSWVDLFSWVGASAVNDTYGLITFTSSTHDYHGDVASESLKTDWGKLAISNGGNTANSGWRTLTSAEWTYLFNGRTSVTTRYCKATVNSMSGVVLFPDSYTHPEGVTPPASTNTTNEAFTTNTWSSDDWSKMEAAGCVFLPAAGYRKGNTIHGVDSYGYYWSSSSHDLTLGYANYVFFDSGYLEPNSSDRDFGFSVRLVRPVE